ncbi:hypothetical protein GGX14DRAFT_561831 [Mycena pura]|uniref:Carboxylesterase type B domain-containing protein n=1 Tax=Mycena pura TaxID=153505 RepID=A0AAD6YJX5_9AGAR|nr:hypothetical protein GGX14DRAFT_561831 [Mycena pura]
MAQPEPGYNTGRLQVFGGCQLVTYLESTPRPVGGVVPVVLGNMQNDGSAFVVGLTNLTAFIEAELPGSGVTADLVRSLYPGQNDTKYGAFRYSYGAVFADLQKFPNAGTWHSSEIGPLFGTFERSAATPAEVTCSSTFQTAVANFVKNPEVSPAVNWPKYVVGPPAETLAKLASNGNVGPGDFVDPVTLPVARWYVSPYDRP